ncbi:reverse transcriptase [Gossypium australe]|uniref:Reverse transcriptase n=1 Tax=Gossypium australe TaxID=47621 RepID=A0A5B6UHU2_9ROSI|nr:reverse transcriptase [Gossypium australe]
MSKEVAEYVKPTETRGRTRIASRLKDMLSTLEDRVVTLEEFMGMPKRGSMKLKEDSSIGSNPRRSSSMTMNDTLEAMMMSLKEEIADLKGDLIIYEGSLAGAPKSSVDAPKPKEFKGTRLQESWTISYREWRNTSVPKA